MDRVRDPRIWEAFLKMWISELRFRAIEPEFLAVEPAKLCRLNKQTNKCREFLGVILMMSQVREPPERWHVTVQATDETQRRSRNVKTLGGRGSQGHVRAVRSQLSTSEDLIGFTGRFMNQAAFHLATRQEPPKLYKHDRFL